MEKEIGFGKWLLGEKYESCSSTCLVKSINENEGDLVKAQELVGGEIDGDKITFATKEEAAQAKSTLLSKGIDARIGNRNPLALFIGKPDSREKGKYGMGPFAAEIVKAISENPSAKAEVDRLVKEKGAEVKDTYSGADLEEIFSRMELKKYSKTIPAIPNEEKGETELNRQEEDEKTMEFLKLFPDFESPIDLIISKFKEGENVCPYVRTFIKRGWLGDKNNILSVAKTNKIPNYQELENQLENC
jgi:hypothetical protein